MKYKVYINTTDVTNYIQSIDTVKESKTFDDKILSPEYKFTFGYFEWLDKNRIVSPLSSIEFVGMPFLMKEKYTDDTVINGTIKDIQVCTSEIYVLVEVKNSSRLKDNFPGYYIRLNPAEIIKNLCEYYDVPYDERSYKKIYKETEGTFYTLIGGEITFQQAINEIAQKACIQVFFTGGKIYFDSFNPFLKTNSAFTLTDDDVYNDIDIQLNTFDELVYTNFQFKSDEVGDVLLFDEDGFNFGSTIRKKLGDKPYDELDGSVNSSVRINTAFSGFYNLLNYIRFYGRYFRIININLDIQKYNAFRLDTIFTFNSNRYNFNERFEVRDIVRDYQNGKIKITAWQLETITRKSLSSGYGITPYGSNYGN